MLIAAIIAIVAHETAHVLFALILGVKIKRIGINWKGPYIVRESGFPWQNALVAFAGPLTNILLACFGPREWRLVNLVLGLTNLLPWWGSDGERIWKLVSS